MRWSILVEADKTERTHNREMKDTEFRNRDAFALMAKQRFDNNNFDIFHIENWINFS